MRTEQSKHNINKSQVKVSDLQIIRSLMSNDIYKLLFAKKYLEAATKGCVKYLSFLRVCLSNMVIVLLRLSVGGHSTGLIVSACMILILMVLNSTHVHPLAAIFAPVAAPFVAMTHSQEELRTLIFEDIRSEYLLIFTMLIGIVSALQWLVSLFLINRRSSRGRSIISHMLRLVKINIPDSVLHLCVEPILIGCAGYFFIEQGDALFGLTLWICGVAELITQMLDRAAMLKKSGVLNA